ncbi:hypothetical protein [Bosea lathyri]|uniref:Uncharacterized protein n=1 Tax=Bosea lathyri TaxID=1036778 RepID=A0A1H6AWF2_9HYPH|nr:hypothetical protein [Bosea lathyri]SEG52385.1 hypothetical protein SAMN04488115_106169 [Bosea lathyri]
MARKTPEQLAQEFEGRKAKGLAKGGAAYWPNVLANAVLKLTTGGSEISVATLLELIGKDAESNDVKLKAGAIEAIARLRQAVAKGADA